MVILQRDVTSIVQLIKEYFKGFFKRYVIIYVIDCRIVIIKRDLHYITNPYCDSFLGYFKGM